MNRAIQVSGLKKSYGSNIVLNGLDFEIERPAVTKPVTGLEKQETLIEVKDL